jgi:hypothetical protein
MMQQERVVEYFAWYAGLAAPQYLRFEGADAAGWIYLSFTIGGGPPS